MLRTPSRMLVPLGASLEDRREAGFSTDDGPLLVFGGYGSGKSLVLKKLLKRAVEARLGPVLAFDGAGNQRYHAVASALGGRHLVLKVGPASKEEAVFAAERLGPEIPCLTVSWRSSVCAPRGHALCDLLAGCFPSGPPPHHFLDPLDAILDHEPTSSLVTCLWAVARRYSLFTAGAVFDHEAFFRHPAGRGLVSNRGPFS